MAGKPIVRASRRMAYAIDALSKNTLADIVIDMIQGETGDGAEDEAIAVALQPRIDTVARLRGDKPVNLAGLLRRWDAQAERYKAARDADGCA